MSATNPTTYDLIEDYLSGRLNEEQTDALWAELLTDGDAMDYLQTMSAMKKLANEGEFSDEQFLEDTQSEFLISEPIAEVNEPKTESITNDNGWFDWKWVAAALVIMMAAAGISYVMMQQSQVEHTGAIALIEYDIFRSAGEEAALMPNLEEVIMLSASGEHNLAINKLNDVRLESGISNDPQLDILEGSLHYNAGAYDQSLDVFTSIDYSKLSNREFEEVLWYKANARIHAGQTLEATTTLQKIIEMDGSFSRVAQNLLNSLNR